MDIDEVGRVIGVADGITSVYGLNNVMAGEVFDLRMELRGMVPKTSERVQNVWGLFVPWAS